MIESIYQWSSGGNILSWFLIAHRGIIPTCMVCMKEESYNLSILSYFFLHAHHACGDFTPVCDKEPRQNVPSTAPLINTLNHGKNITLMKYISLYHGLDPHTYAT